MSAVAKAGGGNAEHFVGSERPPTFELSDDQIREESARLDFDRDPDDVVYSPALATENHLLGMVWDYNRTTPRRQSRRSLDIRDPYSKRQYGQPPAVIWHYPGSSKGRVVACPIDVDGVWSRGLLESPVSNLLLSEPLFFSRRKEASRYFVTRLEADPAHPGDMLLSLRNQLPRGLIVDAHQVGGSDTVKRIVPLFQIAPDQYQGRFRPGAPVRNVRFDLVRMSGPIGEKIGETWAVNNPPATVAEANGNEPDVETLSALAAVHNGTVRTLGAPIPQPPLHERTKRSRPWNGYLAVALFALLLTGTIPRLEAAWSWTFLGLFLTVVFVIAGLKG